MKKMYTTIAALFTGVLAFGQLSLQHVSTYETGSYDESAAEIVTYDKGSQKLFFGNAEDNSVGVLDFSNPSNPTALTAIDIDPYGDGVNSVSAFDGVIAVAVEVDDSPGKVVFFEEDGTFISSVTVGYLPDMVTFSPDGNKVLVACEGEPSDDYLTDPEGSVAIIDVSNGVSSVLQSDVILLDFNGVTLTGDVRIFGQVEKPKNTQGLFFSEYGEGSGNNKYMEIYNGTGQTVYLDTFAFPNVSNAPSTPGEYEYWQGFPQGDSILDGDVYVISHPSADPLIQAESDHNHTYLSNGNDGFCLVSGGTWNDLDSDQNIDAGEMTGYTIVDCLGDWNGDPGSAWQVGDTIEGTKDHVIVRKGNITAGNPSWAQAAGTSNANSEFEVWENENWSDLGEHTITAMDTVFSTPAQDIEPEYITVSPDGKTAFVALQENNALAIIDLTTNTITSVKSLGYKDHSVAGYGLDASDKDDSINITTYPFKGMYLPDAITSYSVGGNTYVISANEGDARDYDGFSEEERLEDVTLDPNAFPNAATLQDKENGGRINITISQGDTDGDGDFDEIYTYGGRSFSIWSSTGDMVYDSGDEFEQKLAELHPDDFNSDNDENDTKDSRSDAKGPEPEAVEVAMINGEYYAFVGLERMGGIMFYNVNDPTQPSFVEYVNHRDFSVTDPETSAIGDLGVEDILFISGYDSPDSLTYIVTSNEVSGTVSVFEVVGAEKPMDTTTVGVADQIANQAWSIYPNPVGATLSFSVEGTYEVLDATGRIVIAATKTRHINVSTLREGVYMVRNENGDVKRFVKQ